MILALTGGFLGSGKTTAIMNACKVLISQHKKVAVITNDQGDQQVDSALIKTIGIMVKEVGNGCFCCQYHELENHIQQLDVSEHPDFIFAESVGSCTDLIATLVKPLSKRKPDLKVVISVFADAGFLSAVMEGRTLFADESIRYIYKKQLEEADVLVINKTDTITTSQLDRVDKVIQYENQGKTIIHQNSLEDVAAWLSSLDQFNALVSRQSLKIDYSIYGDGESKLAWLDKSLVIKAPHGNGAFIARGLIRSVFDQLRHYNYQIGHLKFFIEGHNWHQKISFTATSIAGEVSINQENVFHLKMLINARVQTEPRYLKKLVDDVIDRTRKTSMCMVEEVREAVFKPGYPMPVHRED